MERRSALKRLAIFLVLLAAPWLRAEDGYELWLRYRPVSDTALLEHYRSFISELLVAGSTPTLEAAREELTRGLRGLLGVEVPFVREVTRDGVLVAGTPGHVQQFLATFLNPVTNQG